MVKPIPLKLLRDVATLRSYTNDSGRGQTFGADVELKNIRIEVGNIEKKDVGGVIIVGKALLWYDRTRSLPKNTIIKKRDEVIHGGVKYIVKEVFEAKAFDRHHDEIILE